MSLSIHKLLQILDKCDLYASKYYSKDGMCVYINMVSKINGNEYMLYVPSKYNISVKDIKNNVYEIKSFDISKRIRIYYLIMVIIVKMLIQKWVQIQ